MHFAIEGSMNPLSQVGMLEQSKPIIGQSLSTRVAKVMKDSGESSQGDTQELVTDSADSTYFGRLPDELIERIVNFVGIASSSSPLCLDPYETGWDDSEEVIRSATSFAHAVGLLRLVSWRFFDLATPLFFKHFVICAVDTNFDRHDRFGLRLINILSMTPGRRANVGERIPANSLAHGLRSRECSRTNPLPYGHHVRQLIISNRMIPPYTLARWIDMIHPLLPNLTTLSGLDLTHMACLFGPSIRFPRLVSIAGIDIAPCSEDGPTPSGYSAPYNIFNPPSLAASWESWPRNSTAQEILWGILNHHPRISELSCRGLCVDESVAERFLSLLRTNLLSIALLAPSRRSEEFVGLRKLHFGANSVIDLHLIRLLPSVAPHLAQLYLDAGCHLEDAANTSLQPWSLNQLLGELPKLTHLTFIAQHGLPARQGSLEWASSNEVLKHSPLIQSLNLRMDSLTAAGFFDDLAAATSLRRLNIWYKPIINHSARMDSECWSIISFESADEVLRLGHIVRTMIQAGLEWPSAADQRRDLWLKLRVLSQLEISDGDDA